MAGDTKVLLRDVSPHSNVPLLPPVVKRLEFLGRKVGQRNSTGIAILAACCGDESPIVRWVRCGLAAGNEALPHTGGPPAVLSEAVAQLHRGDGTLLCGPLARWTMMKIKKRVGGSVGELARIRSTIRPKFRTGVKKAITLTKKK